MRHSKQFGRKVKFLTTVHKYFQQFHATFEQLETLVSDRPRRKGIDAHIIEQFLLMTDHPPEVEAQKRAEARALQVQEDDERDRELCGGQSRKSLVFGVFALYVFCDPLLHALFEAVKTDLRHANRRRRLGHREESWLREAGLSLSERDDLAFVEAAFGTKTDDEKEGLRRSVLEKAEKVQSQVQRFHREGLTQWVMKMMGHGLLTKDVHEIPGPKQFDFGQLQIYAEELIGVMRREVDSKADAPPKHDDDARALVDKLFNQDPYLRAETRVHQYLCDDCLSVRFEGRYFVRDFADVAGAKLKPQSQAEVLTQIVDKITPLLTRLKQK
jgi:hypothetical protein